LGSASSASPGAARRPGWRAGLTGGLPPAEALAKAQERAYSQESTNIAVAAGFLCFGAG